MPIHHWNHLPLKVSYGSTISVRFLNLLSENLSIFYWESPWMLFWRHDYYYKSKRSKQTWGHHRRKWIDCKIVKRELKNQDSSKCKYSFIMLNFNNEFHEVLILVFYTGCGTQIGTLIVVWVSRFGCHTQYRKAKRASWPRNMLLLKNPQFLPNFFETWSKWSTGCLISECARWICSERNKGFD